ncbi:MAG: hypothetical protein ACI31M_00290 [Bacilli bacterium]
MNKNKLILKNCPNFYRIINFEYFEDDSLSERLINIYEKFIFNIDIANEEDVKIASQIDKVLARYIEDYQFRKEMKYSLQQLKISKSTTNILKSIVEGLIHIFDQYEEGATRKIYISRWI